MEVCRHIAQNPRIYASDAAGIQSYTADMAAWMSQNGSSPAPDHTTYPLSPGTAGAGSRECFRCGVITTPPYFGQRACIAQNGREVPQKEQNLRNAVGAILYPPASAPHPVSRKSTRSHMTSSVATIRTSLCLRRSSRKMARNPPIEGWCDSLSKFPGKRARLVAPLGHC
ncbi:hypothetical protein B0H11DRAFT_1402552 [Mycena galericulata]|nr:hypothetical protein B0H11DRAFT_1402552 [Mycena galericulata]